MKRLVLVLLVLSGVPFLAAQEGPTLADQILENGKDYYTQGNYLPALTLFQQAVADPAFRSRPEPYFWLAKTYFAILDPVNASSNLEYYIQNFPRDPGQTEAAYLKGRVAFAQNDPEKALQAFSQFLEIAPAGEQVANALFWMGEAAWALGRSSEAAAFYTRVVQGYPSSFKLEASRYRLAVLELQQREEELLKLLRWSHSESMNSAEEFQRREKAYQVAAAALQKKLAEFQTTDTGSKTTALEETIKQKDAQIAALKLQMAGGSERLVAETVDQTALISLLELKSRALDLKSFYLTWKATNEK